MSDKEIKINSINLTIGKKEISLTVEEAKKLKEALNTLFAEAIVYRGILGVPNYWCYRPFWSGTGNIPKQPFETYYGNSAVGAYSLSVDIK